MLKLFWPDFEASAFIAEQNHTVGVLGHFPFGSSFKGMKNWHKIKVSNAVA